MAGTVRVALLPERAFIVMELAVCRAGWWDRAATVVFVMSGELQFGE
jgi:hypothetical protein